MMDKDSKSAVENTAREPAPAVPAGSSDVGTAGTVGRTGGSGKEGAGDAAKDAAVEIGGRGGADPARYGDWEINGRCVDF